MRNAHLYYKRALASRQDLGCNCGAREDVEVGWEANEQAVQRTEVFGSCSAVKQRPPPLECLDQHAPTTTTFAFRLQYILTTIRWD